MESELDGTLNFKINKRALEGDRDRKKSKDRKKAKR